LPGLMISTLRLRGFRLSVFCDPYKDAYFIKLWSKGQNLADVPVSSVNFKSQQSERLRATCSTLSENWARGIQRGRINPTRCYGEFLEVVGTLFVRLHYH
jgi:hypothetical protein